MAIYYGDGSNSDSGSGRCIQRIVSSTNTGTVRANNSGYIALGGFSVSITPKENNHKILVEAQLCVDTFFNGGGGAGAEIYLQRSINNSGAVAYETMVKGRSNVNTNNMASISFICFDNPQTTSTVVYTLYGRECHGNTQATFNATPSSSNFGSGQTYTGTLIATEVAT